MKNEGFTSLHLEKLFVVLSSCKLHQSLVDFAFLGFRCLQFLTRDQWNSRLKQMNTFI